MKAKDNQIARVVISKEAFRDLLFPDGTEIITVVDKQNEVYRAPHFEVVVRHSSLRELNEAEMTPQITVVHTADEHGKITKKEFHQ